VGSTVTLGRIAGIPIGVNWSWPIVFGLFVWSLSRSIFPSTNPGLTPGAYAVMGVAATTLFFLSLLLHELGHAVTARREGVEIEGITLWLFGGVARVRGALPGPGAEFRIAAAGPFVTALLVLVWGALARGSHFAPAVDGVVSWLSYINLFLLGFNLLPGLPLDGGRVLHSGLWRARGDFGWATMVAAATGRVVGIALIAGGFLSIGIVGLESGAWLALVGWFVFLAAGAEAAAVSERRPASRRDVTAAGR
jgi:Zn-dependent protease